jgi:hypothetical protein
MSFRRAQPTWLVGRLQQEMRSGRRRLERPWPENGRSAVEEEDDEEEEEVKSYRLKVQRLIQQYRNSLSQ